jgi:outer membrane protein
VRSLQSACRRSPTLVLEALFLLAGSPTSAQAPAGSAPPPACSLEQAVETALREHPSLRRLGETRQAAEARERGARSDFYPRVTLEAIEKDGPPGAPGLGFTGLVNSTLTRHAGASVVVSQMIYDFGRALHRTRSRRFAADAVGEDEQAQRAVIVLDVYQAYNNALLALRLAQLAQQNVTARELTVKQAQARFDAGLTSRVDLDLAQANLAEARVGLVNAQNQVEQAFADLDAAMGRTGPTSYSLEELPPSAPRRVPTEWAGTHGVGGGTRAPPSTSLEQDVAAALRQRPEIRSIEAQVRAEEETARAARAGGLPLIRGLVSGGYLHVAPGQSGLNHDHAIGVGVSFPLYTGGQVQAEVDAARHQAEALRAVREEQAQTIRLQVTRARLALTSLAQSQQATEEQLRQARDGVNLATQRYQEGLGNFLELQQAQVALLTAETSAARLRYETITAEAALRYALGTLASR